MIRVVFLRAVFATLAMLVILAASPVSAQELPQATDVTSADIQKFINDLPRDAVSDRPIRIVNVTGNYQVGVWGVFRPKEFLGGANLHEVDTTEIYYMVEGVATLVTGGTLTDLTPAPSGTSLRGSGIEGGVSRRITKGDVVIIPAGVAHGFSEITEPITYMVVRIDPEKLVELK